MKEIKDIEIKEVVSDRFGKVRQVIILINGYAYFHFVLLNEKIFKATGIKIDPVLYDKMKRQVKAIFHSPRSPKKNDGQLNLTL